MQHDAVASASELPSPTTNAEDVYHSPSSASQAGRKRKAGGTGSRGVASLTPDQLAKKRANDREAQRAIRERTKHTIENLERRIQELTSQQPYQELQEVIRQKDVIQAENEEIRRRLASIMSIIQPIVGAQGLTDLATAAQNNLQAATTFSPPTGPQPAPYFNQNGPGAFPSATQGQLATSSYEPVQENVAMEENRTWPESRDALNIQRDNLHKGLEINETGERVNLSFLLDSLGQRQNDDGQHLSRHASPTTQRSGYPVLAPSVHDQLPLPQAPWTVLPKNTPPTCPLDRLLLNFLQTRQREPNVAHDGTPILYSAAGPSVSSLLNPQGHKILDPLSQLMTDIISKFPNISALPEQTGVLSMMFNFMRWQVHPTKENYQAMPECCRPTPSQLYNAHPVWIDHLPWPRVRDFLIAHQQDYPFDNWFLPFTAGLSANWPYDPIDCLLSTADQDEPVINPVFERHIRRLDNWSVGQSFAEAFPQLVVATGIRVHEPTARVQTVQRTKNMMGQA